MLTVDETRAIAEQEISAAVGVCLDPRGPAVEAEDYVVWVYSSDEFWANPTPINALYGNSPIAVDRADGTIHRLSTRHSITRGLTELRAQPPGAAGAP